MTYRIKPEECLYVVVRVDDVGESDEPWEQRIRVKEIVSSEELAEAEVKRLNQLNSSRGCAYFWQAAHVYPPGMSAGTNP